MKAGWEATTLGNVLGVVRNGVNCKQDKLGGNDRISRIESIADGTFNLDKVGYAKLGEVDKERNRLQTGDILFSHINSAVHIGKTAIFNSAVPVYHGVNLLLMRPGKKVTSEYLALVLKFLFHSGYWRTVCKQSVNQASVNQQDISIVTIRYPISHVEQMRIVGLLDQAFAGIAIAKANAQKNLQNARALFDSHLKSVLDERGASWERLSLQTLLNRNWIIDHMDGNHGGDYPRKQEFVSQGVPYISARCIEGDRVNMTRAKYLSNDRAQQLRKGFARDQDVLFAHNATVGPVAILSTDLEQVVLGTSLTYYRCNPRYVLPEYLAHYMRSFGFRRQYLSVMTQSTRNQVPITKQRQFFHVIPPVVEQNRMVSALDGLFHHSERLESVYSSKLTAFEQLKKSLLHQAFTGKL